jgi:hypothetical protein
MKSIMFEGTDSMELIGVQPNPRKYIGEIHCVVCGSPEAYEPWLYKDDAKGVKFEGLFCSAKCFNQYHS